MRNQKKMSLFKWRWELDDAELFRINLPEQVVFKLGSREFIENCQLERKENSLRMMLKHLQESMEQRAWHW